MTIFGAGSMAGGPVAGLLADTYGWQVSFWVQVGAKKGLASARLRGGEQSYHGSLMSPPTG
jgi:MFS family permease